MHYSNGRVARVGDIVRGKGYNVKHEIVGLMLRIKADDVACNCEIACISSSSMVYVPAKSDCVCITPDNKQILQITASTDPYTNFKIEPTIEYGQCDAFVALDPKTGEVLLPEVHENI